MGSRTSNGAPVPNDAVGSDAHDGGSPRILLPVEEPPGAFVISLLHALAQDEGGSAHVSKIVSVPEQTPLDHTEPLLDPHRGELAEALDRISDSEPTTPLSGAVRVGRQPVDTIASAVDVHGASTVLTGDLDDGSSLRPLVGSEGDRLRANLSCRVVRATNGEDRSAVASMLVPVAGGPHSEAAVDVAGALAKRHDAWIDFFHVLAPTATAKQRKTAEHHVETARECLAGYEDCDTWVLEGDSVPATIIEQSAYYDVTVLGAPRNSRLRRFVCGSDTAAVTANADSTVVTVWAATTRSTWRPRWL